MKRKIQNKLALTRETLRNLSDTRLGLVVGGIRSDTDNGGVSNCTDSCLCDKTETCTQLSNCC